MVIQIIETNKWLKSICSYESITIITRYKQLAIFWDKRTEDLEAFPSAGWSQFWIGRLEVWAETTDEWSWWMAPLVVTTWGRMPEMNACGMAPFLLGHFYLFFFLLTTGNGDHSIYIPVWSYRKKILFQKYIYINSGELERGTSVQEAKAGELQTCKCQPFLVQTKQNKNKKQNVFWCLQVLPQIDWFRVFLTCFFNSSSLMIFLTFSGRC